jgi:hypothetical protein
MMMGHARVDRGAKQLGVIFRPRRVARHRHLGQLIHAAASA